MRKWRGNGERMRKWREIHSQDFLILCLFPPSLSISYIKNCHILSQNVKYGTFVANVTKNLTYALWGNNSGSNSLRGSSASCAGLLMIEMHITMLVVWNRMEWKMQKVGIDSEPHQKIFQNYDWNIRLARFWANVYYIFTLYYKGKMAKMSPKINKIETWPKSRPKVINSWNLSRREHI